jgi:hypothetical protein
LLRFLDKVARGRGVSYMYKRRGGNGVMVAGPQESSFDGFGSGTGRRVLPIQVLGRGRSGARTGGARFGLWAALPCCTDGEKHMELWIA